MQTNAYGGTATADPPKQPLFSPHPLRSTGARIWQSPSLLSAIVSASSDAIITISGEGYIQSFNPGAEAIFGVSREAIEGKTIELLIPEHYRVPNARQCTATTPGRGARRFVKLSLFKGLRADGQSIDLEGQICQVSVDGQHIFVGTFRDVTQRLQSEERRKVERVQLAELTRKLMSKEQSLVSRVANAMHDHLGQTLAAIQLTHDTMGALRLGVEQPLLVGLNQRLGTLVQQAIRQVRQVVVDLCPPLLGDCGLHSALDNEVREMKRLHSHLRIALHVEPSLSGIRWPRDVEYAAFMIAREALANALRHASAGSVILRLNGDPDTLRMDIVDDGVGIPLDARWGEGSLGLAAMHERANAIGAVLLLDSGDNGGTRVGLRWQAQL